MAFLFSIVSGKGGTGKSTLCAGLAKEVAKKGKSVLAVDFDIGLRSLDLLLSLQDKVVFDLGDLAAHKCNETDVAVRHNEIKGLSLICSPRSLTREVTVSALLNALKSAIAVSKYEYVFIDLPAGLGLSVLVARELNTPCIMVTLPEPMSIRDSTILAALLPAVKETPSRLIINRVSQSLLLQNGINDLDEVLDEVGLPLLGVLPEDPYVNSGVLSPHNKSRHGKISAQSGINAAARRILGEDVPLMLRKLP